MAYSFRDRIKDYFDAKKEAVKQKAKDKVEDAKLKVKEVKEKTKESIKSIDEEKAGEKLAEAEEKLVKVLSENSGKVKSIVSKAIEKGERLEEGLEGEDLGEKGKTKLLRAKASFEKLKKGYLAKKNAEKKED